jgi:hypothetical protein
MIRRQSGNLQAPAWIGDLRWWQYLAEKLSGRGLRAVSAGAALAPER